MGKLKNGAFGHVSGRIGNLVCYTLNGENVVRQVGHNSKPPTEKKLDNYQRMTVVNQFQKPLLPFLNIGFAKAAMEADQNPYNTAISFNKINALKGDFPFIEMDYSKALVSKGMLPSALDPAISIIPNGIEFTWQISAGLDACYHNNRAMLLLYFPQGVDASGLPYAVWELSGTRRRHGVDFIGLDSNEQGKPFEAYISFIADDRLQVSNSVWVG
ncbi:MAG TPA: DUF6266 family protein [Pedobacter sp.]|nr:DUF6266 family protein [Pedobacter sp.]